MLGFFKYAGFLAANLNRLAPGDPLPVPDLALPLGISFFTFQLISYQFDVFRRQVDAERSLAKFAAYILMFPHLIAGPIVRFAQIRDELHADRRGQAGSAWDPVFHCRLCRRCWWPTPWPHWPTTRSG